MIKVLFACILISVVLTIGFAALNDSTVTVDLESKQTTLESLVPPVFSITDFINPDSWKDWLEATRDTLTYNYPDILTGTLGTLLRFGLLIPLQIVTAIVVIALLTGMIRGSIGVSWD